MDSAETGDPQFRGWYVTGAWVVTGEHRPYDRKVGYARRVIPKGRWGAVELIARYGLVDVTDKGVDGELPDQVVRRRELVRPTGASASARLRPRDTDKLGKTGRTNQYFTRVQWAY